LDLATEVVQPVSRTIDPLQDAKVRRFGGLQAINGNAAWDRTSPTPSERIGH